MSRGGFKIEKNSYDHVKSERVSWIDEFADNIERASKTAVEVARERSEISLYDQINSIVSRQPVHATVEDKVKEYHQRTGLDNYLKSKQSDVADNNKVAFSLSEYEDVFPNTPNLRGTIINFIKNKIETSYGQASIPAIQDDILSTFKEVGPEDVENDRVAELINNLITEIQKSNPPNDINSADIGKGVGVVDIDSDDTANTDFYHGLLPTTK